MSLTRRAFAAALLTAPATARAAPGEAGAKAEFDHLMWLSADLDSAVARLEAATGLKAEPGGSHPGGTHNAIVGLGGRRYLEVIAPEPGVTEGNVYVARARRRPEPHLAAWCVRAAAPLPEVAARLKTAGVPAIGPFDMSRSNQAGEVLDWSLLVPTPQGAGSAVPFLIDWKGTPHPAPAAPQAELLAFEAGVPDPQALEPCLAAIGLRMTFARTATPRLTAVVRGPRGEIALSS